MIFDLPQNLDESVSSLDEIKDLALAYAAPEDRSCCLDGDPVVQKCFYYRFKLKPGLIPFDAFHDQTKWQGIFVGEELYFDKEFSRGTGFIREEVELKEDESFPLCWHERYFSRVRIKFSERQINSFSLTVKTMTSKTITISVQSNDTIWDVKKKLFEKGEDPPDQQRLMCRAKVLEDPCTLGDYGISTDCTIYLIYNLRGGMYHPSSGRNDFKQLCSNGAVPSIRIKYGPNENDEFKMSLARYETKESLLEKVTCITNLKKLGMLS